MRHHRPVGADYFEYYDRYVGLVPDGDITMTLADQWEETEEFLASIPAEKEEFSYASGKWSVREVVGHLIDTERVFAFRSLWIARGADAEAPSMDQDQFGGASNAGGRLLADLTEEWRTLRASNIQLFRSFDDEAWMRVGMASGLEFRVRAFPWIIAGHELYHRALLKSDYLAGGA
jgi:hypothetical protein